MATLKKRNEQNKEDCWDLTKLIADEAKLKQIVTEAQAESSKILALKGHILDNKETLTKFLEASEKENRLLEQAYIYTYLKYDEDTSNTKNLAMKQEIENVLQQISNQESFVLSELMAKDFAEVEKLLTGDLAKYHLYFARLYRQQKRILSEQEEKIITKALNAFGTPDDTFTSLDTADAKFADVLLADGTKKELTHYNWSLFLEEKDQDDRRRAFQNYYAFYKEHKNTYAALLKGNYQELEFLRDIRNYDSALSMALDKGSISPKVYENLIANVHKYMDSNVAYQKIKAKVLNNKEYHLYDTYVPISKMPAKVFSKEEGIAIVKEALKPLGEDYLGHFNKILQSQAVDFYPNLYKHSGAYHYGCYDSLNYVLLNYTGNYDSVSTLAHELGHAVHSFYSKENNPYIYADYDIFLAEIASTVNETLLSFYFLNQAETREEKIFYLCEFLDKVKATIYRQTMFAEFESIMSKKCQAKEALTEEVFSNTYYELNEKYFKDSVIIDPEIRYEWMRIPHFYTPFYVYKYATGLICAICIVKDIMDQKDGFVDKYLTFLKSGSNQDVLDILKIVNIDLTTNEPYEKAFTFINECLEKLKKEVKQNE